MKKLTNLIYKWKQIHRKARKNIFHKNLSITKNKPKKFTSMSLSLLPKIIIMISRIDYYWKRDIKKSYVLLIRFYESSQKFYANLWDAWYWLLKIRSRWKNPINFHKNCQNATTFRASASNVDKFFTRPLNCLLLVGSSYLERENDLDRNGKRVWFFSPLHMIQRGKLHASNGNV